jgi:hypothetical protein
MKAEAARNADTRKRKKDELESAEALVRDGTVQLEPSALAAAGAQAEQNATTEQPPKKKLGHPVGSQNRMLTLCGKPKKAIMDEADKKNKDYFILRPDAIQALQQLCIELSTRKQSFCVSTAGAFLNQVRTNRELCALCAPIPDNTITGWFVFASASIVAKYPQVKPVLAKGLAAGYNVQKSQSSGRPTMLPGCEEVLENFAAELKQYLSQAVIVINMIAAFPLGQHVMKVIEPPPTAGMAQARCNRRLLHARRLVEQAFGRLKGVFVIDPRIPFDMKWRSQSTQSRRAVGSTILGGADGSSAG